jgi:hypothetical protein
MNKKFNIDNLSEIYFYVITFIFLIILNTLYFLLDRNTYFLIGDSAVYLNSGINEHAIPVDRSFTYGFYLIHPLLKIFKSINSIFIFQSLLSIITSVVLSFIVRFAFGASYIVCFLAALLYSIEPINLMLQHFILTETVALFFFALLLATILIYISRQQITLLPVISFLAVIIVSFRTSFLPVVLTLAATTPLFGGWRGVKGQKNTIKQWKIRLLHLLIAVGLTFSTQIAYKNWAGYVRGSDAAYGTGDGFFLLASWTPIVTKEDFPNPTLYNAVVGRIKFPLEGRSLRPGHRFSPDGLIFALIHFSNSEREANNIAQHIAYHAALRNPLGILRLGWETYLDFWNPTYMSNELSIERGRLEVDKELIDYFHDNFSEDISRKYLIDSPIKRWFSSGIKWYHFILISPIIFILILFCPRKIPREPILLFLICIIIFILASTLLVTEAVVRYLHPIAFLVVILLAVFTECLFSSGGIRVKRTRIWLARNILGMPEPENSPSVAGIPQKGMFERFMARRVEGELSDIAVGRSALQQDRCSRMDIPPHPSPPHWQSWGPG